MAEVNYDDHRPATDDLRRKFLLYFFSVQVVGEHLASYYVAEKIEAVYERKEMWQLEQLLHPSCLARWRQEAEA